MSFVDNYNFRFKDYAEIADNISFGKLLGVPLDYSLGNLSKYVPTISRGDLFMITAFTGWGKTQFTKHAFVFSLLDWLHDNPQCNIDLKILYFALEETEEEFIDSLVVHYINKKFGIIIPINQLKGRSAISLNSKEILFIQGLRQQIIDYYASKIHLVTTAYSPEELYMECQKYLATIADISYKTTTEKMRTKTGDLIDVKATKLDGIKYHNPNTMVVCIADHINLMEPQTKLKEMMDEWSATYCKSILTKEWDWAVINVTQQSLSSGDREYNYKNEINIEKTLPTISEIGDSRMCSRHHKVILGLYNPHFFNLQSWNNYNIMELGDNFRSILLLKNRGGTPIRKADMFFDGNACMFNQLPSVSDPNFGMLMDNYNKYKLLLEKYLYRENNSVFDSRILQHIA
jgi:translation initiation factor IF-1